MSKWSCEEVVNWLAEIGLGDLGHIFESRNISGEKLATITDKMLENELEIGKSIGFLKRSNFRICAHVILDLKRTKAFDRKSLPKLNGSSPLE